MDESIVAQGKFLIPLEYLKSKGIIDNNGIILF